LGDLGGKTNSMISLFWHSDSNSFLNSLPPSIWIALILNGNLSYNISIIFFADLDVMVLAAHLAVLLVM